MSSHFSFNGTLCSVVDSTKLCFYASDTPFYFSHKTDLVDGVQDIYLTLAAPIIAYWGWSMVFQYLDTLNWKWVVKYRIHDSVEMQSRNRVTKMQVMWAVLFQQVIQTVLGYVWLEEPSTEPVKYRETMMAYAQITLPYVQPFVGPEYSGIVVRQLAYAVYWWAIPLIQLLFSMFIIDTWQYFLHRWMHVNKWMYRHFHSWHHRLYVPYGFGALYNHPLEGFLLDTLGTGVAEAVSLMSTRQAMFLFSFSTFKTVDDHCGYRLPFDPLQLISGNNADYHDIHHQTAGIKANFSQPFFVHWDTILGTKMTRAEMEQRQRKGREAKQD